MRSKLTQLARAEGYSIAELFGGASTGKAAAPAAKAPARKARKGGSTAKVAPKYRNPANPSETWAGRGKQPRWLSAYTNAGRKLEDFLIR